MEYASKFHVVASRKYHDSDKQLQKVASVVSTYAFEFIKEEYDLLISGLVSYSAKQVQTTCSEVVPTKTSKTYQTHLQGVRGGFRVSMSVQGSYGRRM